MTKPNSPILNDTLRVRLPSSLKYKLIEESTKLNIDLSELVRQRLDANIFNELQKQENKKEIENE